VGVCAHDDRAMRSQMDANEFFNMLFDKVDHQLKATPHAMMLRGLFGGTLSNQLISNECGHSSSRGARAPVCVV
jgi:hypothetical protein